MQSTSMPCVVGKQRATERAADQSLSLIFYLSVSLSLYVSAVSQITSNTALFGDAEREREREREKNYQDITAGIF
jgi:hypothetical protein